MSAFHRLSASLNGHDMIAIVDDAGEFWQAGSASGPVHPAFVNRGKILPGDQLRLAYNYADDEYATRTGWYCTVVRINRKTVTVKATTGDDTKTYRVEVVL